MIELTFFIATTLIFSVFGIFTTPCFIIGLVLIAVWLVYVFIVWKKDRSANTQIKKKALSDQEGKGDDSMFENDTVMSSQVSKEYEIEEDQK